MDNALMTQAAIRRQKASLAIPPTLNRDPAFWGLLATQFLGAFNDNLFKQIMLLLATPAGAGAANEQDAQWTASVTFALPFVLFSGIAGFLSDKYSKRRIIILAKLAEIGAMALGMIAFLMFAKTGYGGLLCVLFLMGTHSAFFGPSKYGILPELFRLPDLPKANGLILMTTFLAIIIGTAAAGLLGDLLIDPEQPLTGQANRLWIGSAVCIVIAFLGASASLSIRATRPANPSLTLAVSSLTIPVAARQTLRDDLSLVAAIMASSVFWLVSGIAVMAVNSLGRVQLQLSMTKTSILTAVIAIGISLGAVLAGRMLRGRVGSGVVRIGTTGIVVCLLMLSISWNGNHLLGFSGSLPVLILLGAFAGMFAIPVQVFIQSRPPDHQKGQLIAVMNLANFVAILLSGVVYKIFDATASQLGWQRSSVFGMMALLFLPMAIRFRLPATARR
jgi:acyl-[acyl-carrier-protein]-phospholipid O-acyltransferase/long-chain-fatty-acid--[acyl-carrier-protein] ligase